jgi:hypothetical protein
MPVDSTTHHAASHLNEKHDIHKLGTPSEEIDPPPQSIAQQIANIDYKALITSVQADRFRYLLIRWIVYIHIALSIVEHQTFRQLILYICPALKPFFVKQADTIRRWILAEFRKQRTRVKAELVVARSLIHISFDL